MAEAPVVRAQSLAQFARLVRIARPLCDAAVVLDSHWRVRRDHGTRLLAGGNTRSQRLRWLFCLLVLPFVAHSVSLAASSQAIGYRTILPLSGLFLVLLVFALRAVVRAGSVRPVTQAIALGALVFSAAVLAQHNAYTLIAEPQSREWQLFHAAAARLRLAPDTDVYIIRPTIEDRSTERVYDDEFGSLSSDADWAAKEMFKTALRERFPRSVADGKAYTLKSGWLPPDAARQLRSRARLAPAEGRRRSHSGIRDRPGAYCFATLTTSGSM